MWSGFLLLVRNTGCEGAASPGCLLVMTHSLPGRVPVTFPSRSEGHNPPIPPQPSGLCIAHLLRFFFFFYSAMQMPCFLFLHLIPKSFPMLFPAQCRSKLLVPFQIFLQIPDFHENPLNTRESWLKPVAHSRGFSRVSDVKRVRMLTNES